MLEDVSKSSQGLTPYGVLCPNIEVMTTIALILDNERALDIAAELAVNVSRAQANLEEAPNSSHWTVQIEEAKAAQAAFLHALHSAWALVPS